MLPNGIKKTKDLPEFEEKKATRYNTAQINVPVFGVTCAHLNPIHLLAGSLAGGEKRFLSTLAAAATELCPAPGV